MLTKRQKRCYSTLITIINPFDSSYYQWIILVIMKNNNSYLRQERNLSNNEFANYERNLHFFLLVELLLNSRNYIDDEIFILEKLINSLSITSTKKWMKWTLLTFNQWKNIILSRTLFLSSSLNQRITTSKKKRKKLERKIQINFFYHFTTLNVTCLVSNFLFLVFSESFRIRLIFPIIFDDPAENVGSVIVLNRYILELYRKTIFWFK